MSNKELSDLEVRIEIAKIYKGGKYDVHSRPAVDYCGIIPRDCVGKTINFNPITDNALNLELRDEYKVSVDYHNCLAFICVNGDVAFEVYFTEELQINRVVLECILESVK